MMKYFSFIVIALVMALCACNQGAKSNPGGAVVTKAGEPAKTAEAVAPAEAEHKEPSEVKLGSGQSVKVIEVAALDSNPNQYAGQIAISGKVEAVFADRGTFTLVDCGKMVGCADSCCSKTAIPMSVPETDYEGKLPEADQEVIVIGTLTPGETGYSFEVTEVRGGEQVLISRKSGAATQDA
jgi:hypothetical protein